MPEPTMSELLARIEELERPGDVQSGRAVPRRGIRGRRVTVAVAALVALLLVPVGVFANHQFTDVPKSNTFHASIAKVKGAGITGGCSATKFCPDASVTRGQMAAFLARTAGRAEYALWVGAPLVGDVDAPEVLAAIDVKAGEATGGTAYVSLSAAITAFTDDLTNCPCTGAFYIYSDSGYGSFEQYASVSAFNAEFETVPYGIDSTTIATVLPVPTGVTETIYLAAYTTMGDPMTSYGEMTAEVNSFDGLGRNVPALVTTTGRERPTSPGGSRRPR